MTAKQPVLSIIIAAYNIESTIDRIFTHLFDCKLLDEIEVIVVNDGSKDATLERAREYEAQYPQLVHVLDKPNGGHGSALSAGFKVAQGRFCRPLDGDDWLDPHGLDALVSLLKTMTADMVICDNVRLNLDTNETQRIRMDIPSNELLTLDDLVAAEAVPVYHGVIYSTAILQTIPELDHHCFYVDNEYDTYPMFSVKSVYYLPTVVYVHTTGNEEQSTSNASLIRNEQDIRTVFFSLLDYARVHGGNYSAVLLTERYAEGLMYMFTLVASEMNKREGTRKMKSFYKKIEQQYPDFYKKSHGTISDIYRYSHFHGYMLVRMLLHLKLHGRSIVG